MERSPTVSTANKTIRLADYKPPGFSIPRIALVISLDRHETRVKATLDCVRQDVTASSIRLDGSAHMRLAGLAVDGTPVAESLYDLDADGLSLKNVPDQFTLTIDTVLDPAANTRLEGLYLSEGCFCTQCEAEGFRHITFFPDRPDILSLYDVRIEASREHCPVLLSNGNCVESGTLPGGRHYAVWRDPFPKPCYLFALVAGDLECLSKRFVTRSGRPVDLHLYAKPHDIGQCGHALASLKRAMRWDEDVFGLEYDLDVYNIVAVSDFNMGAMENKSLNIFNTKFVLAAAETATDRDFDNVEGVIGHEYFHNWTGNRVTCRDWFQLSLKEGLTVFRDQEFSSDMGSRALKRLDDVRLLRTIQFPEDSGPLAHPVRPDSYVEINNFYTATVYNKGAEVIRMMRHLIGMEAFQAGMALYIERHDGQAVTCEDFVRAMEDAGGRDLTQFRLWYAQSGTPRLDIRRSRDETGMMVLEVAQSCPPTPGQPVKEPFHMPLVMDWLPRNASDRSGPRLVDGSGQRLEQGFLLELRKPVERFVFANVPGDAVPSLLRGFSAPVILKTDVGLDDLSFLARHDDDAFVRFEAAQTLGRKTVLDRMHDVPVGSGEAGQALLAFFTHLLSGPVEDAALTAELLSLPGETEIGDSVDALDPVRLHRAREAVLNTLAANDAELLRASYAAYRDRQTSDLSSEAKAIRRLSGLLLSYVARLEGGAGYVGEHYRRAFTMTERMAALVEAAHIQDHAADGGGTTDLLDDFYRRYEDYPLVIDKWFAVQAQSRRGDTLQRICKLKEHPAFTLHNPNRVRAVFTTFSMANPACFHTGDGSGYELLAETIMEVDPINPQVAARLVAPLGRWRRLEPNRQTLMRAVLERILSCKSISSDVRELVQKSLQA